MIEEIIDLLPSPDLKSKIKETNHKFSELELLKIICNYAPSLDSKHSFLERFSKIATPDITMFAKKIIESDKNNFANFIKESNEFVYELHIKDTPYSHDERYICKSYNAALICIDRFFEEYAHVGAKETEETRYTIDKRKIFSECDKFEEDEYAECILGANKEILSISDWRVPHECDTDVACCECEKLCPAKLDDLKSRTIDEQAIPCLIPMIGTSELNSNIWLDLQKQLRDEKVDLLIEDIEFEQEIESSKEYFTFTDEEKFKFKLPYIMTMALINEAINLSQEWRDGKVKLIEPRSGTKDIIVAFAYGNYVSSLIINNLEKGDNDDDLNIDEWQWLSGNFKGF